MLIFSINQSRTHRTYEIYATKYHLKYIDILKLFLPSELRSGKVKSLTQTIISLNQNNVFEYEKLLEKMQKNILGILEYLKK